MPEIHSNYQKKLDQILQSLHGTPRLLLHACCAPCSSYVLEYLTQYFKITLLFYNPNIAPEEEYKKRLDELMRLISLQPYANSVQLCPVRYDPEMFEEIARGYETEPEGGARCIRCYRLRMEEAARYASEHDFDFFTTTLSISPHKNAQALNEIGEELSKQYSIPYLYADFKKRGGYQRSIVLSRDYQLYRQNFCGCRYSQRDPQLGTQGSV